MSNFANQNLSKNDPEPGEPLDDFAIEITDLLPSQRSHYLLLNLKDLRGRLKTSLQQLAQQSSSAIPIARDDNQELADDFAVEISDLPPGKRSHYALLRLNMFKKRLKSSLPGQSIESAQTIRQPTRAYIGRALLTCSVCLALFVLLLGNAPNLRMQLFGSPQATTQTPDSLSLLNQPASNSRVIVHRRTNVDFSIINSRETPGLLPETCPQTSSLQRFLTPLDPPGVGGGPLWITGFAGPTAALIDLQPVPRELVQSRRDPFGWYTTITLFVQKGFANPILLTGGEQPTARPLAFGDPNNVQSITNQNYLAYLNLINPSSKEGYVNNGQWEIRALNVFIRSAGCYFLQANWNGGMWIIYFAVGEHL